jgi:hypothetical protein
MRRVYLAVLVVSFWIYVAASPHEFDFIETYGHTSIDHIKEALCKWPGVAIGINLAIQRTQYPTNPKETGIKNQNRGILGSYRLTVDGKKSCAASASRPAGDVHIHDELGRQLASGMLLLDRSRTSGRKFHGNSCSGRQVFQRGLEDSRR